MENQFRQAGFDLKHPRIAKYLELSIRMLDLPRHLGQHSGGMIIAQDQLASVVPIEPASMPGRNVVQWDKEDCADMGLIKVDLLGLGMMAVMKDCRDLIAHYHGETLDLAQLPQDDPDVYETLQKADTIGLFQVESSERRWRRCRVISRTGFTTLWCRLQSSGRGRLWGR